MNRHGSSFGSNNCSKRVVFSVFIHFLCCGFGRVLRSASTGDAPFLGVPKSPVFSPASPVFGPASPVLGWQIPSFLHFFRFLLHRFWVFLHDFCIFSHLFVKFSACANANWQISGVICCVFRWSFHANFAIICVKIPQWGIKMIKFIPHWGNFSEEFIPHWGIICIFAAVLMIFI